MEESNARLCREEWKMDAFHPHLLEAKLEEPKEYSTRTFLHTA
jgi:hypothetical protein